MGAFLLQNWRKIMAKRKKTPNQKEYAKQIKRIKQTISRAEKRGYIFEDNIIPEKPKRITKQAIKKLRDIKPNDLYKKARAVDYETGEIFTGLEARKLERKASAKKAAKTRKKKQQKIQKPETQSKEAYYPSFTDIVISNYRVHIHHFNEHASSLLENWLNKIISTNGADATAKMLNDGAEAGYIVTYQIVYKQEALLQYMSAMLNYLPEAGTMFKEEMMDAIEIMEDWESPE